MRFQPFRHRKYAALFGILCLGSIAALTLSDSIVLKLLVFNAALAFAGVALGYGGLGPTVFGKRGAALPWWCWLLLWPYIALNYLSLWLFRHSAHEAPFHEVAPGLLLGCRLWPRDKAQLPAHLHAVLDLTAEFPEVGFLRVAPHYLCLPILDTTAPTLENLQKGVQFLATHCPNGPVYVHCALGHGRSATYIVAYLLSTGQVKSVTEAVAQLRAIRPGVGLHHEQHALLETFHEHLSR